MGGAHSTTLRIHVGLVGRLGCCCAARNLGLQAIRLINSLRRICRALAQSGHAAMSAICLLSEAKRTAPWLCSTTSLADDPKATKTFGRWTISGCFLQSYQPQVAISQNDPKRGRLELI